MRSGSTTRLLLARRALPLVRISQLWYLLLFAGLIAYPALSRDLWSDEAFTLSYTFHSDLKAVIEDVRKNEETPPLYFVGVWLWSQAFGHSEPAIRGFSVVSAGLALLFFARLANRRLGQAEARLATVAFALAPLLQFYLLEARVYALALLLSVVCIAAFEHLRDYPHSRRAFIGYGLSAAALFLTSYFGLTIIAAHWLIWLAELRGPHWRRRLNSWMLSQVIIAACVLPWLAGLLYQVQVSTAMTTPSYIGPFSYYLLALATLMGFPLLTPLTVIWLLAAAAGWGLILAALLRGRQRDGGLTLRAMGVPALTMMLLIAAMRIGAPRYLIGLIPGLAIGIGSGYGVLRERRRLVALGMAGVVIGGMLVARIVGPPLSTERAWPQLTQTLAQQADPASDVVLFTPPWDQRLFSYYYQGPVLPLLGAHDYDEFYYYQGHQFGRSWTSIETVEATKDYKRIWIFHDRRFYGGATPSLPYPELGRWQIDKVELILYGITPPLTDAQP